ncbi:MAG: hypothetical protein M1817_004316 [Caeruleum heppii]|nr:MAG: hypothetical protein M1817_004316 [Caeruleum heppii]
MAVTGDLSHPLPRAMSVQEITQKAEDFVYNPLVPLKYWLRTADILLKEAQIYEREGDDQQAYLLLFRHAKLVLSHLSTHPHARDPENSRLLEATEKTLPRTIARLESLKPRITERYERSLRLAKERDARQAALRAPQGEDREGVSPGRAGLLEVARTQSRALAAGDNRDLAVRLAHGEIRRRENARRAVRRAGITSDEEQQRRAAGLWGNWGDEYARNSRTGVKQGDLQQRMVEARRQIDGGHPRSVSEENGTQRQGPTGQADTYKYPVIPKPQKDRDAGGISPLLPSSPPPRPDKATITPVQAPDLPSKEPDHATSTTKDHIPSSRSSSPQPSSFTFTPSAQLENGTFLRTIFLPPTLRTKFLSIAQTNTTANLETCGILCGTLISNALFISRLVIPEQESTSDTCETVNESALFDYCDSEDLMVLGWIHTHPTQTCFMSSRDLHTHAGYQVMMPESIAIVCAPSREPSWGIFRLTDPPGMKTILNCHQTGLFHPHGESEIYTDALKPGHVFEARGLDFEVVDLR